MKRLLIVFIAIQLIGCEQQQTDHPILKYFPETAVFEDGYVSKYYDHYYPDNRDQNPSTKIIYVKYQKIDESHFSQEAFNAAFDLEQKRLFEVNGDSMKLLEEYSISSYDVADTINQEIVSKLFSVWNGKMPQPFEVAYTFDDEKYIYAQNQLAVSDTIIDQINGKLFTTEWTYRKANNDSILSRGTSKSYYLEGLGFYGSRMNTNDYSKEEELVEQMSLAEFALRAGHDEHRVAWINPEKTLSDDSNFEICGHERNIADYYNSTPDGRYIHNKRALMDTVNAHLDKSKLFNQSGKLVFRFVVNCEGKAGRFIAEGYDLSYNKMVFDAETIDHLFSILLRLKEWRKVVIRDEARDAYFYITFNIEDGEIIDILP